MSFFEKLMGLFFGRKTECRKESAEEAAAFREEMKKQLRTSVSLSFEKADGELPQTCSKFGGFPALPENFAWPYFSWEGRRRPLAFLLQINLEEFAPFDADKLLPPRGMLYFFYETDSMCWGFDPKDEGCARVYFYDGELSVLSPVRPPVEYPFDEARLRFEGAPSLPSWEEFAEYNDFGDDFELYDKIRANEYGVEEKEEGENSKLLGYADVIQNEMPTECEQVTRGIYLGDGSPEIDEAEKEDIHEKSRDWTLLLQLGTVNAGSTELMWGDSGCLYFYIRKQDLAAKNFDDVWMILQCD